MAQNTVELSAFENFLLVGASLDIMKAHVFPRTCHSDEIVFKFVSKVTNAFVSQSIPTKIHQYDFSNSLSRMVWLSDQGFDIIPCPMISDNAVMNGNIPLLEWLSHRNLLEGEVGMFIAAKYGRIDIIMFLQTLGFGTFISHDVFKAAAYGGQVHVLEWLFKYARKPTCLYEIGTLFSEAGYGGQIVVIDWLISQELHITPGLISNPIMQLEVLKGAARSGNLSFMKAHVARIDANSGFYKSGIPENWDTVGLMLVSRYVVLIEASDAGHVPVLEWLQTLPNPVKLPLSAGSIRQSMLMTAASKGHVPMLKWLQTLSDPIKLPSSRSLVESMLLAAASEGHVPVLEWLQALPNPIELSLDGSLLQSMVMQAFSNGHMNVVVWLEDLSFPEEL
jgi:hypothetical protein